MERDRSREMLCACRSQMLSVACFKVDNTEPLLVHYHRESTVFGVKPTSSGTREMKLHWYTSILFEIPIPTID